MTRGTDSNNQSVRNYCVCAIRFSILALGLNATSASIKVLNVCRFHYKCYIWIPLELLQGSFISLVVLGHTRSLKTTYNNNPDDVIVMSSELFQLGVGNYKFLQKTCVTNWRCDVWKTWVFTRQLGSNERCYWLHYWKCRIQCFWSLTYPRS